MSFLISSTTTIALNGPQVYPNPTTSELYIDLGAMTQAVVSVFNTQGQLIYETRELTQQISSIDLSELPAAMYLIRVVSKDRLHTFGVIKEE